MARMTATSSLAGSRAGVSSRVQSLIATLRTDRAALQAHVASLVVGVGPWLATILSLLVLLTGVGAGNLEFGWQIQFTGAVFFGLAQLVISDHDGPVDWRDFAGLGLGALGLMFSAVSLAMVAMVGINLALRSRWRAAAIAVLPLAAAFVAWYLLIGH